MSSYVKNGKDFERKCANLLARLYFKLNVVGKAGDQGVDLRGIWELPSAHTLPIVAQCKTANKKIGPVRIRELEGVLHREPAHSIALLISNNPLSSDALEAVQTSGLPIGYVHVETPDGNVSLGRLARFYLNRPAEKLTPQLQLFQQNSTVRLVWNSALLMPSPQE